MQTISLVLPFHSEEDSVAPLFELTLPVLNRLSDLRFETNDGSRDGTLAALRPTRSGDSRIVVIDLARNFGKEAALTARMDLASGDAVTFMDANLQHPRELIPELVEKWREGARCDRMSDTF